jgi:hypothetical protein
MLVPSDQHARLLQCGTVCYAPPTSVRGRQKSCCCCCCLLAAALYPLKASHYFIFHHNTGYGERNITIKTGCSRTPFETGAVRNRGCLEQGLFLTFPAMSQNTLRVAWTILELLKSGADNRPGFSMQTSPRVPLYSPTPTFQRRF